MTEEAGRFEIKAQGASKGSPASEFSPGKCAKGLSRRKGKRVGLR